MLADFLAWIWPALPAFFLAAVCFVIAGVIWLVAIRRHDLAMGPDPDIRAVAPVQPAPIPSRPAPPNYVRREDEDTQVIRPYIPGATLATPPLSPQLAAVQRYLADVREVADATAETTQAIEGLRVIPSVGPICGTCGGPDGKCLCIDGPYATEPTPSPVRDELCGPVCPTCGGPFGNCQCYGQKSAPKDSAETQVVDLCPLTTQDIVIDDVAPHFAETFTRHPRAELGTQELSGSLARAKESAA